MCHWKWIHQLIRLPAHYLTNSAVGLSRSCWTGLFSTNVTLLQKDLNIKNLQQPQNSFSFQEQFCLSVASMNRLLMIVPHYLDQKLRFFGFQVCEKFTARLQNFGPYIKSKQICLLFGLIGKFYFCFHCLIYFLFLD